jgi:excinuclease UvrABC nuclease subunit
MNARPRYPVGSLTSAGISPKPGVYALYRDGRAVYVGKAKNLGTRLWTNHFRRGKSMTNSALRRNVAEFLGIALSADIKAGRYRPTADDALHVSDWIRAGEVGWIECETEAEAITLEDALKAEWKPPLTKI